MTTGAIRRVANDADYVGMAVIKGAEHRLVPIVKIGKRFVVVRFQGYGDIRVPSEDIINVC